MQSLENTIEYLNKLHANIKFTYEKEDKGKLSFLDVLVKRVEDGFHTSIYHKPTFTGVYLNWLSLTSRHYKTGLIKCLLTRAWRICSNYDLFQQEVIKIREMLKHNNYPCKVVNTEIKKFIDSQKRGDLGEISNKQNVADETKRNVSLVLPYYGKKAEEFKYKIMELVQKYYPSVNFRVIFVCPTTISSFFPFKNKTPLQLRSKVVYKITCKTCNEFYIGETTRCLCRRVHEHKECAESSTYHSSVYKHQMETGHIIDFDGLEILDSASNVHKLRLKEMLHIIKLKPKLNVQKKSALFSLLIGEK